MNSLKMNKIIGYVLLSFWVLLGVSCDDDSNSGIEEPDPYDHESQIPIDQALLYTYFEEHYISSVDGELIAIGDDDLPDGETRLSDDVRLDSIVGIEANETITDYKMYYYILDEGVDESVYGNPCPIDSVFVKYKGMLLDGSVFDGKTDHPIWLQLSATVQGWSHGFTKFKRGTFETEDDDDFVFDGQGTGYLFFPSGLGYKNIARTGIPENSPLVFQVELNDVNLVDSDVDSVPSKYELIFDAAGNIETYDTDGDGFEDYRDVDDDNDQVLTKVEVADEYPTFDPRGNVEFEFGADGNIAAKGSVTPENPNGDTPNYKNAAAN